MKQQLITTLSANDENIGERKGLFCSPSKLFADCVLPKRNTEYCISFCLQRVNNIVASAERVLEWHSSEQYDPLPNLWEKEHVFNEVLCSREIF